MEYRELGKSGLRVSQLGFGCGNVGGLVIRGTPTDQLRAVVKAIEAGINYFDTAPSYGNGQSERNLGQVLRELKADVYVGTKVQIASAEMVDLQGAITRSVDASLERLGRNAVDLIQLHNRITQQRDSGGSALSIQDVFGDVIEAFQRLQSQGKVKYYGITGLGETAALHQVIESGALYTVQVCYNLLNPSAGHPVPTGFPAQNFGQLIDRAAGQGMGSIGIRVLAAGALAGVEERHPLAAPSVAPIGTGSDYRADVLRAQTLAFLVEERYVENLVEAALRFAWSKAELSTALVGFSSLGQLEQAVTAAERGGLPREALRRLEEAWSRFAAA